MLPPLPGEEASELGKAALIIGDRGTGTAIGEEVEEGEFDMAWLSDSRNDEMEGDTARRLAVFGYGSKRSSSTEL